MASIFYCFTFVALIFTCEGASYFISSQLTQGGLNNFKKNVITAKMPAFGKPMKELFLMDQEFIQLNHGTHGTYPLVVQTAFNVYQTRAETNTERWMRLDLLPELNKVKALLGEYLNANGEDLVAIPNTTHGMNAIFRSIKWLPGDRILHFSTAFKAMKSIITFIMDRNPGVTPLIFNVTYPITNDDLVKNFEEFLSNISGVLESSNEKIRIALIDHISSQPGVVNPLDRLIPLLKARNIEIIVDGAHSIGQVPVDIKKLDVDYYVTNCYKWLYSMRGTAVMYVKKEHQGNIHPPSIGRYYSQPANYELEFIWEGSIDYSPYLTIPTAIEFRRQIGEERIRNYMHDMAVKGGALAASILGTRVLQSEDQIGAMIDVELPLVASVYDLDYFTNRLLDRFNMFVATYQHGGKIWTRLSAQIYTDLEDFEWAARALKHICCELNQEIPCTQDGQIISKSGELIAKTFKLIV